MLGYPSFDDLSQHIPGYPEVKQNHMGYPRITRTVTYPGISKDKYGHSDLYQPVVFLRWKNDRLE